jgi:ATP-dependent Clp protease ATP-binding subunit ClpA
MHRSVVELAEITAQRGQPGLALAAIVELRERLEALEEFHVEGAREQGWSWREVAQALGVTRQAVHRKYAKRLDDAHRATPQGRIVVTAEARRCVARARREAVSLRHDSVGTDHLLLGLTAEKSTAEVLAPLGVSVGRARTCVVRLRGNGEANPSVSGRLALSTGAAKALEQSLREALRLAEGEIAAKHVLLALLRPEASRARRVLDSLEVSAAAIEERLAG